MRSLFNTIIAKNLLEGKTCDNCGEYSGGASCHCTKRSTYSDIKMKEGKITGGGWEYWNTPKETTCEHWI